MSEDNSSLFLPKRHSSLNSVIPVNLLYIGWILAICSLVVPFAKVCLKLKRKYDLIWLIPGCKVNNFILYLIIAKSILFNKSIKANILSFQVLCGSTQLFYKEKIWKLWLGVRPVVIFFMPETVEVILNSNTVLKKTFMYDFLNYWFKEGLITSAGSKWKTRRKLLTPAFHFRILADFQPVIDEQSRIFVDMLQEKAEIQEIFDVVHPVTLCTLDILCETAMGIKINAQRSDSEYISALKFASEQFSDRVMKPWVWPDFTYYLTSDGRRYKRSVGTMLEFTTSVIRERKKEMLKKLEISGKSPAKENDNGINRRRKAFLDLMLDHHLNDGTLTEQDIREEVDTFMFAGHDTTAMGISWALYSIGLYPKIQETIHEELDRIFGHDVERSITTEDVREMKYLECVLKESQRLFPSLPVIGRELEDDVVVHGYTIPKGTTCMLATFMLHRNPEVFPNPEVFDPERFLPENCVGRHPFAYVPFSAGPRNCIGHAHYYMGIITEYAPRGQRFAMMEEKTVVANILRHYQIESVEHRDKLKMTAEMVLRNDHGLFVKMCKRKS